jgi:mono/diheme cytochrome c family protein
MTMSKICALLALAPFLWLAGCAVEFENTKAAKELEARERPPGSVYLGWRVFEDRCARCHGGNATGKAGAPDLLVRVRTLGPREFADLVLLRYRWAESSQSDPQGADRQAYVDDVVRRRRGEVEMPAWQGEPRVTAHIIDLHAYLSARAEGTQGPGRPAGP